MLASNKKFLDSIIDGAKEGHKLHGVPASVSLSQAILESGWGKRSPGNNLFGIKADPSWKGIDLAHTASASPSAKTIKCCDLISNTTSIVAHDKSFAKVYLEEKGRLLDVLVGADPSILARARALYEKSMMDLHLSK